MECRWLGVVLLGLVLGWCEPGLGMDKTRSHGKTVDAIAFMDASLNGQLGEAHGMELAQSGPLLDVTGVLEPGDAQLEDGSFYDIYEIRGEAGQTISILLESIEFDPYVLVIGPDGEVIAENDDLSPEESNYQAGLTITLSEAGRYQIHANSVSTGLQGNYHLVVELSHIIPTLNNSSQQQQQAYQLFTDAITFQNTSQFSESIRSYEKSLEIFRILNDQINEGNILGNLGLVYENLGLYDRAHDYHQQSLAIAQEVGNRVGEGNALGNIGLVYSRQGQYTEAIDYHQQSLAIAQEIGNRRGEGNAFNNLGNAYSNLSQYEKSINYYQESLTISEELGDQWGKSNSLNNLGNVYSDLGEYDIAETYYRESLDIDQAINNIRGIASVLGNLGNIYSDLGEYRDAIEYYQESINISQVIGVRETEGNALGNLGNIYYYIGQYGEAINYYEQSINISQEIGDKESEGNIVGNLGNIYSRLGQYEQATIYYFESLTISRQIGNRESEEKALSNLGNVLNRLGEYEEAINYYQDSLAISQEIGGREGEAITLDSLGSTYINLNRYEEAIDNFEKSLEISQNLGNRESQASTLNNLGFIYESLADYQNAITYRQQALTIAQEIGSKVSESEAFHNLGETYNILGEYARAKDYLYRAIEVNESLRTTSLRDIDQVSLIDTQQNSYKVLQNVLIRQREVLQPLALITEALTIAERSRTRVFVDLLAEGLSDGNLGVSLEPPNLMEIYEVAQKQQATLVEYSAFLRDRVSELYIWVVQPNGTIAFRKVDLPQDPEQDFFDQVQEAISAAQWGFRDVTRSNQLTDSLSLQPGWNIRLINDGEGYEPWTILEIDPATETIVARNLNTVRDDISFDEIAGVDQSSLQTLHQTLIDPIADLLPTDPNQRVIFIPDGSLFNLPFAALTDLDGRALIEKHTILTAPSIQTLDLTRQRRQQLATQDRQGALVVGNPDMPAVSLIPGDDPTQLSSLPNSQTEAEDIARLLDTEALTGRAATKAAVLEQLPQAQVIHFATHGLLEEYKGDAIPGAIALASTEDDAVEDVLLRSREILNMDLRADLVVLSACDTGKGEITGDGVLGLSRAFFVAGTPSVLVSLWQVDDESTAYLMTRFYRYWQTTGDKAAALRQAMLDTREVYPNPRDWAAFTLIGEAE